MKLKYLFIILALILFGFVIYGFIAYVPYYKNDDGLTMTLYDTEKRISALIIFSYILTVVTYIYLILVSSINPKLLDSTFSNYSLRIIPLFPIFSLIINIITKLFVKMDYYAYAELGLDFLNANTDSYGEYMTLTQTIRLGESLQFGTGFYLVWVLVLIIFLHYIWYYRNYRIIFDIDVTNN